MSFNNGEHDEDITAAETPGAILIRIADHMHGVALSLRKAIPLLDQIDGSDRAYLIEALYHEANELRDAAADLGPALRTAYGYSP